MCAGKGEDYERGYSGDRDPALINAIESEERGAVTRAEKRPELTGARLDGQLFAVCIRQPSVIGDRLERVAAVERSVEIVERGIQDERRRATSARLASADRRRRSDVRRCGEELNTPLTELCRVAKEPKTTL